MTQDRPPQNTQELTDKAFEDALQIRSLVNPATAIGYFIRAVNLLPDSAETLERARGEFENFWWKMSFQHKEVSDELQKDNAEVRAFTDKFTTQYGMALKAAQPFAEGILDGTAISLQQLKSSLEMMHASIAAEMP